MSDTIATARVSGRGDEAIAFVHGVGSTAAIWDYQLRAFGDAYRCMAIELRGNGVPIPEADPARITVEDFQSAVTRLKAAGGVEARVEARQQEDRQHLWQYALALMVLLLAGEGLLAARTA